MLRTLVAAAAVVAFAAVAEAQPNGPTYQRRAGQPYYGYGRSGFAFPATQGFTFQRPYPYHLDYYRKRYQGGYEPYFGNLYGPPAVVGTQPFAFSPYPNNRPPPPQPQPTPYIQCPHCQQAVPIQWTAPPAVQAAPAAAAPAPN